MTDRALNRMLVPRDATLLEAMEAINAGGNAIAFVTGPGGRVIGTVTDGDVRRTILAGASLASRCLPKAMRRRFTSVALRASRAEVLDTMRARGVSQVPVLDKAGRLVGLHLLQDLIGAHPRPNWAVILAGGRGERLRPLTLTVPKPMIPVAGRPILERLVLHLVGSGIRRIFISVNYLAHVIEQHFGDGARFGCSIEYLRENEPLGTGGPLSLLRPRPQHPVLLVNGDLVTQFDVGRILEHHEQGGFAATFAVRPHNVEIPFGVAEVRGKQLKGMREKPTLRVLVNTGIYVVSPPALRLVPRRRFFPITDLVERCQSRGLRVGAYLLEGDWIDVGRQDELRRARGEG